MSLAVDSGRVIELLVAVFGTGGLTASFIAFVKVQPETTRIIVSSAKGAVVVQKGVIDDLNAELERVQEALRDERRECDERLEEQDRKIEAMESRIRDLERNK